MSDLKIQLLGELKVFRGEAELNLPPSKKTRALLAYLALNERSFRREQLCELLWEIPDDPRGSLRWSLSKIRRLVDDDVFRIEADRSQVAFNTVGVWIDCRQLQNLTPDSLARASTEDLVQVEKKMQGQFLEGLELSNFHEFSSWCTAQREQCKRQQKLLLSTLVARLIAQPEQGMDYARKLVQLFPYDKGARASLIKLMVSCGRQQEAQQQFDQGVKLLKEVGEPDASDLRHALRGEDIYSTTNAAQEPVDIEPESLTELVDLVGRDKELESISASIQKAIGSTQARCLLLKGDPGMGKTSLLDHASAFAVARKASVFRATAFESEVVRPFALWNDALRAAGMLSLSEALAENARIDREHLFNSFSETIKQQAVRQPTVILFDDVQWADESSAAALHYVLRMNRDLPLWVVLGSRSDELLDNAPMQQLLRGLRHVGVLETIQLHPLNEEAVALLVAREQPEIDNVAVARESQGNPLLAIQLARGVADGNFMGTLNELVGEQLQRLNGDALNSLEWAALLSLEIDLSVLARVCDRDNDDLERSLEEVQRTGLVLQGEPGFRFSHGLVQRCIYNNIPETRRKVMHRRVAELLETDTALDTELAAELARHASLSGDPLLAARSLVQAANLCLRFFANDDAFELSERGLEFAERLSAVDRIRMTLELKQVQLSAAPVKDWRSAADECVALAEAALDHGDLPQARMGYHMSSGLRWAHGNFSGARKEIMQAERVTRGGSEDVHIIGMAEAARCLLLLEKDLPEADAMVMEAAARAERRQIQSNALAAAKGMLYYYENKFSDAEGLLEEARARAKALGERINEYQANEYLCMIEIERRNCEEARYRAENLLALGSKLRKGSEEPLARALIALCDYQDGKSGEELDKQLEVLRLFDAKQRLTYVLNRAAQVDISRGDWALAQARAEEALNFAQAMDRASELIISHLNLAEAAKGGGDQKRFQEHYEALLAAPEGVGAQWAHERAEKFIEEHRGTVDG